MKKLSNNEAELKKSVAYKKSVYIVVYRETNTLSCIVLALHPQNLT